MVSAPKLSAFVVPRGSPVPPPPAQVCRRNGRSLISAAEFVGRALEFGDTDFGRLVLLGSLREGDSYRTALSALPFEESALDSALTMQQSAAIHS